MLAITQRLALALSALLFLSGGACAAADQVHGNSTAAGHGTHWTYDGKDGPGAWGRLSADYATCDSGSNQSPVDIRDAKMADLPLIGTDYPKTGLHILNNGHTIQVNYGGGAMLGGKRHELVQFHFHTPSEHQINGKTYSMEVHLVHKDEHGQLSVIGIMLKKGRANTFLSRFWERLPTSAGLEKVADDVTLNLGDLLPKDKSYYHYKGSLTTPPCSEGVNWYVLKTAVEVSPEQIRQFASLFRHNERPVQPLNGRQLAAD